MCEIGWGNRPEWFSWKVCTLRYPLCLSMGDWARGPGRIESSTLQHQPQTAVLTVSNAPHNYGITACSWLSLHSVTGYGHSWCTPAASAAYTPSNRCVQHALQESCPVANWQLLSARLQTSQLRHTADNRDKGRVEQETTPIHSLTSRQGMEWAKAMNTVACGVANSNRRSSCQGHSFIEKRLVFCQCTVDSFQCTRVCIPIYWFPILQSSGKWIIGHWFVQKGVYDCGRVCECLCCMWWFLEDYHNQLEHAQQSNLSTLQYTAFNPYLLLN